jgi:hypothetical protein
MDFLSFFLHPITLIFFILAQVISVIGTGKMSPITKFFRRILILQLLIYILGFLAICSKPYYFDMGAKEFINWNLRWIWAFLPASIIEMYVLPFALLGCGFVYVREIKQRRGDKPFSS